MTQQRVTTVLLALLTSVALLLPIQELVLTGIISAENLIAVGGGVLFAGLLALHLRGWPWSGRIALGIVTLMTIVTSSPGALVSRDVIVVLVPAVLAAVLLSPGWSAVTFAVTFAGMVLNSAARSGRSPAEVLQPSYPVENLVLIALVIAGVAVAGAVARHAQRLAELQAERAEEALARAARQAHELEAQVEVSGAARREAEQARADLARQLATVEAQRETIRDLSVPILPLSEGTLAMPLVGELDAERLAAVQERALEAVARSRARVLLLDITGVPLIDAPIAGGLARLVAAGRLLGAEVVLVGIRPEIAQALVSVGVDLRGLVTRSSLAQGVAYAGQRGARA